MIAARRQEVMKTLSPEMFSEAKRVLGQNRILCDYSVVYHDPTRKGREVRHLYVRDNDYSKARRLLCSLGYIR